MRHTADNLVVQIVVDMIVDGMRAQDDHKEGDSPCEKYQQHRRDGENDLLATYEEPVHQREKEGEQAHDTFHHKGQFHHQRRQNGPSGTPQPIVTGSHILPHRL